MKRLRWKVGGWVARFGLKVTRVGNTVRHGRGPWDDDDLDELWGAIEEDDGTRVTLDELKTRHNL